MGLYYLEKMPREDRTGGFVGINAGFVVTKPKVEREAFKANKSGRKGRLNPRVKAVREIVAEVCGLQPFQKKMIEMIRTGVAIKEKKAVKLARARVGHIRDNLVNIIAAQKKAQTDAKDAAAADKGK